MSSTNISTPTMEDAEEMIEDMRSRLEHRMRMYTLSHLNSGNLEHHENKIKEREQLLEDLSSATRKFIKKFSSQLGQERVMEVKVQLSAKEDEFLVYRESFYMKVTELKTLSMNNSAASLNHSIFARLLSSPAKSSQKEGKSQS